jgi:predicted RND superfamily exporter protein
MLAFAFSVLLLPALLVLTPGIERRRSQTAAKAEPSRVLRMLDRFLVAAGDLGSLHPGAVFAATAAILLVAVIGAAQVRFTHDVENWFPKSFPLRIANDLLNEEMEGVYNLEVLIETGKENGLHDPTLLHAMDELATYSESYRMGDVVAGKAVSIVPIVKEINQALNENRDEFYAIPDARELIAQELLLFESSGSDDLEDVTDSQFRTGRMTLFIPAADAFYYLPFIDHLKEHFQAALGEEVGVHFTGIVALLGRTMQAVVSSMAKTYLVSFAIVAVLMVLMIGEVKGGLVAMIPNLTPILITVGMMGWVGISFNIATILLGCVAIGIAVDDTIHFMHSFRRYHRRSGDPVRAVRETMETTGRALLVTSLILTLGFSVFSLSILKNVMYFGIVNAAAVFFAFFCNVILAPALVVSIARRRVERSSENS